MHDPERNPEQASPKTVEGERIAAEALVASGEKAAEEAETLVEGEGIAAEEADLEVSEFDEFETIEGEEGRREEAVFVERSTRGAWIVIGLTLCLSFGLALFSYSQLKTSSRYIESSVYGFTEYGKKLDVVGCAEKALQWNQQCTALKSLCVASLQRLVGACLNAKQRMETCKQMNLGRNQGNFTFMRCKPKNLQRDRDAKKACAYAYGAVWSYCHLVRRLGKKGLPMPVIVAPAK